MHLSDLLKKKRINFAKNSLDRESAYLVFTGEATFYEGPIRNRRWIATNQSYNHLELSVENHSSFRSPRSSKVSLDKYRITLCLSPQMTKIFQNLGGGLDNEYKIFWTFFRKSIFLCIMFKIFLIKFFFITT